MNLGPLEGKSTWTPKLHVVTCSLTTFSWHCPHMPNSHEFCTCFKAYMGDRCRREIPCPPPNTTGPQLTGYSPEWWATPVGTQQPCFHASFPRRASWWWTAQLRVTGRGPRPGWATLNTICFLPIVPGRAPAWKQHEGAAWLLALCGLVGALLCSWVQGAWLLTRFPRRHAAFLCVFFQHGAAGRQGHSLHPQWPRATCFAQVPAPVVVEGMGTSRCSTYPLSCSWHL